MTRSRSSLALVCAMALVPGAVRAQDTPPREATENGQPRENTPDPSFTEVVVVTANRVPQSTSEIPAGVTVLTQDEISRAPVRTVDELLRQVPGFSLLRQSPGVASHPSTRATSVRGLGGGNSRTLALVDGIPLNDPFSGIVYWSRVPLDTIERIEIIKSGASGAWGNLALGGVINVITKAPQSSPSVFVTAEGGNQSTGNVTAGVRRTRGRFSASIAGSLFRTGGYIIVWPDSAGPVDHAVSDRNGTLDARLRYQPSVNVVWDIGANYFSERQNFGTALAVDTARIGAINTRGSWQTAGGSRWTVTSHVSHQNGSNVSSTVAPDRRSEIIATSQFNVPATAVGANLQWSKAVASNQLMSVGADAQWIDAETNEDFNFSAGALTRRRKSDGRQLFAGVYAQDLIRLSARWSVMAGTRIDRWNVFDGARRETDIGSSAVLRDDVYPDRSSVTVNPTVGVVMHPSDRASLRGSAYRGFRAPTSVELYRPFRARGNVVTESNALLDSERLSGAEIGADFTIRRGVQLKITGFWDDLSDAITTRTVAEAGPTTRTIVPCGTVPAGGVCRQRQNVGRLRSRGVESEARYRAPARWEVGLTYLFDESRVTDNPAEPSLVGRFNKLSPVHQVVLTAHYDHPRWFTVSAAGRAVGSSFEDDVNSLKLAGFALLDLRVAHRVNGQAELFLSIQNLFDRMYEISRAADGTVGIGAPRLVHGGLRVHF